MLLADALRLAVVIEADLSPFCECIMVAGSVRRRKAEPKDIELVLIPRHREQVIDLFGKTERVNLLHEHVARESRYTAIKPGVPGIEPWYLNPAGLYWRLLVEGVKVDAFLCTPESWGLNVVIRTGSGVGQDGRPETGFGPAVLARWKQITGGGYSQFAQLHLPDREEQGPDGGLVKVRGAAVATPEEEDVFTACKMGLC